MKPSRIQRFPLALAALLLLLGVVVWSADFNVPGDFATIQEAIEAALDDDVVCVEPGTYTENIDFLGKGVVVRSTQGPDVTIIDGGATDSVVKFVNGEGSGSVLDGFTITNGLADRGGGIMCDGALPTICNNTISGNTAMSAGGGISIFGYDAPTNGTISGNTISNNMSLNAGGGAIYAYTYNYSLDIRDNTISGNSASSGGGIEWLSYYADVDMTGNTLLNNTVTGDGGAMTLYSYYSAVTMSNNTLSGNQAPNDGGAMKAYSSYGSGFDFTNNLWSGNTAGNNGGALYAYSYSEPGASFVNNTFADNSAMGSGGGLWASVEYGTGADTTIRSSIFWGNDAPAGAQIENNAQILDIEFTDVQGGGFAGTGNIDDDPLFVAGPAGDHYLSQVAAGQGTDSPAVDTGDPMGTVLSGTTRTDQEADVGAVDMGFHFAPVAIPVGQFRRGDADANGTFNGLVDGLFILNFQFSGGATPPCMDAADADDSGGFNGLVDGTFVLNFQFVMGSPPPPPPGVSGCGVDPTADAVECDSYTFCP